MTTNTIYGLFAEQVRRDPHALGVFDEHESMSYRELAISATRIANALPDHPRFIGLMVDHGVPMIAALLGILKTGAAYTPVEPDFPEERIAFMMRESDVDLVITQPAYRNRLSGFPLLFLEDILGAEGGSEDGSENDLEEGLLSQDWLYHKAEPSSIAYVLYTSGSTGTPKGVVVENQNVCHYVRAFQREFHPGPGDIMLQYSVCSFDIFVEEVFTTLLSGATLAIAPKRALEDSGCLHDFLGKAGITIVSGFPYLLLDLNNQGKLPPSVRLLISGGDVLRAHFVSNLLSQTVVYNTYGPSETTVCATYFRCTEDSVLPDGTFPIGKAISGTEVLLLDDNLRPVPDGATGEICILGGGVSRGYLDASKNTMFLTWNDGRRLYRSGDMAYKLSDGNLAFLNRKDDQVMIRGKRVEPEEVENILNICPGVEVGVVRAYQDSAGFSYLVAYVVPEPESFDLSTVKRVMARYLTPFMIPEYFVTLEHIPLTANGKPDVSALPVVLKEGR